jgi:hypothetical protein
MRQHIYETWTLIMDSDRSPLRNIPDNNARHLILQILAWMWCIVFSIFLGSYVVFGLTAIAHVLLLALVRLILLTETQRCYLILLGELTDIMVDVTTESMTDD